MTISKRTITFAAFLSGVATHVAFSQHETASTDSSKGLRVQFRSIQAEAGTLLFINTINAACDIDVVDFGSGFAAGIRGGIQHTWKKSFSLGGGEIIVGSRYTDIDFLLRLSSSDGSLVEDILFGYTHHRGTLRHLQAYDASGKLKFGGEVKWLLFKPVGGFFFEVNSTVGGATKPVTVLAVGIVIGLGL